MLKKRRGIYYFKKTINGKTVEKSLGTSNVRQAERLAAKKLEELYSDEQGWTESKLTFGMWWKRIQRIHLPLLSKSSVNGFERAYAHVKEDWENRLLHKITSDDCAAYVPRRLKEGAKPSTVALERQLLKVLFNKAVENNVLNKSPWRVKQKLKIEPRERVLSREEEERLFAILPEDLANILRFILWTGLRAHEIRKAQLSDIIRLPVPGLKVVGKGGKKRVIPLDEEGVVLAKKILPLQRGREGLLQIMQRYAKKANIHNLTLHDFRRTFGTRCAEGGMPMPILAEIMGHSNISMTAQFYIHISNQSASSALGDILRGERSGDTWKNPPKTGTIS